MALILKDRVKETTTTTGTGTVTLGGAVTGFQSFAVIGDANTTYYTIAGQSGSEWEVGIGTYTSSGTTLARTTVLSNSSGTEPSALSFSAGTKDVFVTYPSGKSVNLDASGNATALGTPVSATLTNATGLPISSGVSGLGSNVATFLATPSSANLAAAVTDETGTGALVFATSPTLTTPALGTPSALVGTNITGTASGLTAGNVTTNANLTGDVTSVGNATSIASGVIVNADINAAAGIVDTKLATISTALKVSNSATTATNANTASAIVARDASGNFSAGTITAALTGNASTVTTNANLTGGVTSVGNAATVVTNANLTGDVTSVGNATSIAAGVIVNADINASAAIVDTKLATISTALKVSNSATTATNANTASAIVARDASGNFSAGTITAALTGNASGSAATFTSTSQNSQFNSVGVGTAGSGTAGEIRATNTITAYYSDDRFKTNLGNIPEALAKVLSLNGFYYEANELAQSYGYEKILEVGVSAQQVQAVQPEVVAPAPIDENYLTVRYERLVPLLIEAIKELNAKVATLELTVAKLTKGK